MSGIHVTEILKPLAAELGQGCVARPQLLKHITQSSVKKTVAAKCAWNYA